MDGFVESQLLGRSSLATRSHLRRSFHIPLITTQIPFTHGRHLVSQGGKGGLRRSASNVHQSVALIGEQSPSPALGSALRLSLDSR